MIFRFSDQLSYDIITLVVLHIRVQRVSCKMTAFIVSVLNVAISLIDIILLPINYLIYRKPWKYDRKTLEHQPHELIFTSNCSQVIYKPPLPELSCANSEIIKGRIHKPCGH